jgi:hypothetical protein
MASTPGVGRVLDAAVSAGVSALGDARLRNHGRRSDGRPCRDVLEPLAGRIEERLGADGDRVRRALGPYAQARAGLGVRDGQVPVEDGLADRRAVAGARDVAERPVAVEQRLLADEQAGRVVGEHAAQPALHAARLDRGRRLAPDEVGVL